MSEAWRFYGAVSGPRRPGGTQNVSVFSLSDAKMYSIVLDQINVSVIASQKGVFLLQPSEPRCTRLAVGRASLGDDLDLIGEWNIDSLGYNLSMGSPGGRPTAVLSRGGDGVDKLHAVHWIRDSAPASIGGFVSASFSAAESHPWDDQAVKLPVECIASDAAGRVFDSSYSFVAALTALMQHTDGDRAPQDQFQWSFDINTVGGGSTGKTHGDRFGRALWEQDKDVGVLRKNEDGKNEYFFNSSGVTVLRHTDQGESSCSFSDKPGFSYADKVKGSGPDTMDVLYPAVVWGASQDSENRSEAGQLLVVAGTAVEPNEELELISKQCVLYFEVHEAGNVFRGAHCIQASSAGYLWLSAASGNVSELHVQRPSCASTSFSSALVGWYVAAAVCIVGLLLTALLLILRKRGAQNVEAPPEPGDSAARYTEMSRPLRRDSREIREVRL